MDYIVIDDDALIADIKQRQLPLREALEAWKADMRQKMVVKRAREAFLQTRFMGIQEFWEQPGRPYLAPEPEYMRVVREFGEDNDGCYVFMPWKATKILTDLIERIQLEDMLTGHDPEDSRDAEAVRLLRFLVEEIRDEWDLVNDDE